MLRGLTPAGNLPTDVRAGFGPDKWLRGFDAGKPIPAAEHNDSFGIVLPAPAVEPLVMSGTMVFDDVQVIDGPVVIMPGTILRMGPGASVIINGKVKAVGTKDEKIRFVPRDKEQEPWGVFAIRGDAANGSTFGHCVFSGGSGLKEPLAEYSAMFSIHAVQDVSIFDCTFRDSQVVDDMVHAVYSTLQFDNCSFTNSLFDALDLDVCTGSVVRCEFIRSGNDGLDLMASEIVVKDCLLLESVDKGLSVGEGTKALIINCRLLRCEIGVQVKDGSMATISNCDFTDNVKAVDAYKKNWRYNAGGSAYLYGCMVEGGESTLTADKFSRIFVHDSWIDRMGEPNKRIYLDRSVHVAPDVKGHRAAQDKRDFLFAEDESQRTESFTSFLQFMRHKQRGAKK